MIERPEFIDVDDMSQLPPAPEGYRYIDFPGGTKTFQCCLVPRELSRNTFVSQYGHLLDEMVQPIYENKGINVAQDYSFAVPGFYIVAYDERVPALDIASDNLAMRTGNLLKYIRAGMRDALKIKQINLYHDERATGANSVHYGLMPKYGSAEGNQSLYGFDLMGYLSQFNFKDTKQEIIECNNKMKEFIKVSGLREKDDAIYELRNKVLETYMLDPQRLG